MLPPFMSCKSPPAAPHTVMWWVHSSTPLHSTQQPHELWPFPFWQGDRPSVADKAGYVMLVDRMCMQSADTDTTQHAESAGRRLTWLRTSCFCLTVGTMERKEGRKEERAREEWVEEEKGLATLCEVLSSMKKLVVARVQDQNDRWLTQNIVKKKKEEKKRSFETHGDFVICLALFKHKCKIKAEMSIKFPVIFWKFAKKQINQKANLVWVHELFWVNVPSYFKHHFIRAWRGAGST